MRDTTIAEDLTQETLLKAYRARPTLRDYSRIEAWVYQIAHATMVDYYRRRSAIVELRDDLAAQEINQRERVMDIVIADARCYLETLPSCYRDPVHLADYEGLPHIKVARELGLSLTAAKSRIRRGKLMVRRLMEARCRFEYDVFGNIIGYQVRSCAACSEPA